MELNPVAVDLAKSVFQLSLADDRYRIQSRKRLSRAQFRKFIYTQTPMHLVMEGCATSHYWGRFALSQGHQVTLLHPNYVKTTYVGTRQIVQMPMHCCELSKTPSSNRYRLRVKTIKPCSRCTVCGRG